MIELRTASGILNKDHRAIAGVVMITAGYSADGKYSHYFFTQVPIEIKGVQFKPGDYVFVATASSYGLLSKLCFWSTAPN